MRQITATEKYNAVLEGSMAKREFVRQMRQQYPMYVSQYNGFDDTVQILKNRNMIYEASKPAFSGVKVYDDRPALTYSLDALERGIRIELMAAGKEIPNDYITPEEYAKAEKKAKDNLDKDCNHYINLLSGESNKVDKHDREKEVKRGEGDVDTYNGMKKATLKEEVEEVVDPNPPMSEDAKKAMLGKVIGVLKTKYKDLITTNIIKDFVKTHYEDLLAGEDIESEFGEFVANNFEGPSDFPSPGMDEKKGKDIDMSSKDGYIAFIDNEDIFASYGLEDIEDMARELAMNHHDAGQDQDNFVKSFMAAYKEGGYMVDDMEEKKGKDHDGDGDIDSDDYLAAKDKAIKKAMGKDESYAMKRMQHAHDQDQRAGKKSTYDIAKEKQAEKEKQLKEAVKSIIKKTLLNEAATAKLSDWGEGYESFTGVKSVVNELENIVTEIEQFYNKISDKIAKTMAKTAEFQNEEGLKVGAFIAPSLEAAFKQDLRPVIKGGFLSKVELPKVKTISRADIQAAGGGMDETPQEPKATVFTPNF